VCCSLARRLRGPYWFFELAGAVIVAGAIILPFQPTFAAILAIGVVPLIAYPYWRDVRMLHNAEAGGYLPPQWSGIRLKNGDHVVAGSDDG
jgi:hypothetical protein